MQSNFPSPRLALWMAMLAVWPLQGLAAAGKVQFATGDVQLRRGLAATAAVQGTEVENGDVIQTGAAGRAQIRFTDGGLVALYPDSQFTVTRYADAGDAAQDHFAVSLLRGGMRAITGLIGKRDPRNYKVTTPTAVVGIRGSAFLIGFNAQGELVVSGEEDEIEVCTEAGCVGVKAGESVRVTSSSQLPLYTHTRALLPLPPPPVPFAMGEQLSTSNLPAPVPSAPAPTPSPGTGGVPVPAAPTPTAPAPTPPPGSLTPTLPPVTGSPTPASPPSGPPVTGAPTPTAPPGLAVPPPSPPPTGAAPTPSTPPPSTTTPTPPPPTTTLPVVRPPTLSPIVRPLIVVPPIAIPSPPPPAIVR